MEKQDILVTVDNVVLSSKTITDNQVGLYVLLVERKYDPFQGTLAFPGGFAENSEWMQEAAQRELLEETGLVATPFQVLTPRTDPGRDPRGRVISFPFIYTLIGCPEVVAGDDAQTALWVDVEILDLEAFPSPLAFDHADILREALDEIVDLTLAVSQMETTIEYGALMRLREAPAQV